MKKGDRFGYLEMLSDAPFKLNGYLFCKVLCECGNVKNVRKSSLAAGFTKSCGCKKGELLNKSRGFDHRTKHSLYNVYVDMIRRCYDNSRKDYKHYGGRGISVCDDWRYPKDGFWNFVNDMVDEYSEGLELERLDVNKDYSPFNCTFVDRKSQMNNTRFNRRVSFEEFTMTVSEWSTLLGCSPLSLSDRVNKLKMTDVDALSKPFSKREKKVLSNDGLVFPSRKSFYEHKGLSFNEWVKLYNQCNKDADETIYKLGGTPFVEKAQNHTIEDVMGFLRNRGCRSFDDRCLSIREKYTKELVE